MLIVERSRQAVQVDGSERTQRTHRLRYGFFLTGDRRETRGGMSAKLKNLQADERKHVLSRLRHILDVLADREPGSEPGTVTTITPHGIVREEHKDLRGVSSKVADRAKRSQSAASVAAGLDGPAKSQPSAKPVSTSGNKSGQSGPTRPE